MRKAIAYLIATAMTLCFVGEILLLSRNYLCWPAKRIQQVTILSKSGLSQELTDQALFLFVFNAGEELVPSLVIVSGLSNGILS